MSVMTFHVDALRRLCGFNICILMRNCSFRSIAALEQLDTVAPFSSRVNVVRVDGQVHINAYIHVEAQWTITEALSVVLLQFCTSELQSYSFYGSILPNISFLLINQIPVKLMSLKCHCVITYQWDV
ncbi:hypothetical protein ILYODFUR_031536 [Ilyodon furcidens]|uniref:Uncharacterized protein n=1 Tax=Ilyodon furcidens TaxID=33524 RepID=A0ABV0T3B0_9TELE